MVVLAGLSLLVSTEAYQVARPVNPAQVPIVSTDQGALKVTAGPNNPFSMVTTTANGRLVLDMTKGPGGGTSFGFATNSRYTLYQIIRVTNATGSAKNVDVAATGNTFATLSVTGYVNGTGGALGLPRALGAGQYIDLNLAWTTTAATGLNSPLTLTVSGN